jgi:thioredoxin-like negative regulator of GroEL
LIFCSNAISENPIDCEQLQEICAQHGVFSLPVVQVFFMGQKFIEEMRGFSLMA